MEQLGGVMSTHCPPQSMMGVAVTIFKILERLTAFWRSSFVRIQRATYLQRPSI